MLLANEKILTILERTLNLVAYQLVGHGKRVAYSVYKKLYPLARYSDRELRDICMLALLHDIGAYKTDDVNDILAFDAENAWDHSIYGYLFTKHFSPLKELAPVLLFHHAKPHQMYALTEDERELSLLFKECDKEDIKICVSSDCETNTDDFELNELFNKIPFSEEEVEAYIKMVVYCIDFRSPQTMLHTFAASFVAKTLATLSGASREEVEFVRIGAMLHDIGKMGTPLYILESTANTLSKSDMEIMRDHILHSRDVLSGCVSDVVFGIATNHHERLTGNGYPRRLKEGEIPFLDGLMAVADLFSALCVSRSYQQAKTKEKAIEILQNIRDNKLLDAYVLNLAIDNFDEIIDNLHSQSEPVVSAYDEINKEKKWLQAKFKQGDYDYRSEIV